MPRDPRSWIPGDAITAERLEEMRRALVMMLRGDHGIQVREIAGKIIIDAAGAPGRSVGGISDLPREPFQWKNQGATTMQAGEVLVPDKAAHADGKDGIYLALERPTEDSDLSVVWINRSPSVVSGGIGGCEFAGYWPFLARVDKAVDVQTAVGIKKDTATFMAEFLGYRVLAYEGNLYNASPTEYWARLARDPWPPALEVQSIAADIATVRTITEDEVDSGVDVELAYLGA